MMTSVVGGRRSSDVILRGQEALNGLAVGGLNGLEVTQEALRRVSVRYTHGPALVSFDDERHERKQ